MKLNIAIVSSKYKALEPAKSIKEMFHVINGNIAKYISKQKQKRKGEGKSNEANGRDNITKCSEVTH